MFLINNRLSVPLNLKENFTPEYVFSYDTPVLALKINKKGEGMYLGPPYYGYALNCRLVS